ncbi:MAG: antitoxin [Sulfuritalea sp.]|nr:antitoxin [Sulfuritalea sp.]
MATGTVFVNNRTQAVRLPSELRLPDGVKKVNVRAVGKDRIISPITETWDSFFAADHQLVATEDFMTSRATQEQAPREAL